MALIKDGYWQGTYWPSRYWQEDYWLEYGTAVAAPPPTAGDTWIGPPVPRPAFPVGLIVLVRDYVQAKVSGEG